VKGTLKGTVSFGAGAKAGYEAELSWTKVKVSSQLAVTLGLGAGGQGTVEIDVSKLTTGIDLEAVAQQDRESKIASDMIKSVKIGQYKLPPGKTWQDILPEMRKKLEWIAKHPEVLGKDQKAHEELMKSLKFEKGKGQQRFISVRKKQQDWYCTNKPTISSPTSMSEMINQEIDRKNTMRKAFGMPPIEPWED
jgi:Holliday junction resolvase